MRQSLVKSSELARKVIIARLKQLGITQSEVIKDAESLGRVSITKQKLSVYINHTNPKNGLKEEDIIWLSIRYCIGLTLKVDMLEYNKEQAITNLKKHFGNELGGNS